MTTCYSITRPVHVLLSEKKTRGIGGTLVTIDVVHELKENNKFLHKHLRTPRPLLPPSGQDLSGSLTELNIKTK